MARSGNRRPRYPGRLAGRTNRVRLGTFRGRRSTLPPPMASLESLPPDQRAVLQLVLRRGRSYDDIAQLLAVDRAGVRRARAAALDAIGPRTRVPAERRALITDYLLGALPSAARPCRCTIASPSRRASAPGPAFVGLGLASLAERSAPGDTGRGHPGSSAPRQPGPPARARQRTPPRPAGHDARSTASPAGAGSRVLSLEI